MVKIIFLHESVFEKDEILRISRKVPKILANHFISLNKFSAKKTKMMANTQQQQLKDTRRFFETIKIRKIERSIQNIIDMRIGLHL